VVDNGQFVQRGDRSGAIVSWASPDTCSPDALYMQLLNAQLDTRQCIYQVYVIASEQELDVFLLSSHAITDATSLVELHACLAYLCDCVVRQADPGLAVQPFPTPVDAAVERSLAALPAGQDAGLPTWSGAFAEIPMRAPYRGGAVTHRLERTVIGAQPMQRISAAAHAHGVSVHAVLLAAFALAIGDVAPQGPRRILMRSSVDMRRRIEPHVSPELVFSAITGHISPVADLDRPLFDIARELYEDIHEGVANGAIFHDYLNYPKSFGGKQQAPVALNISDMQSVRFHWPTQQLKVTGFEYACGWLKTFPNVSVSVFDGQLVANTAYVEEFVDPRLMRAISERVVSRLLAACAAPL
jgi:hypothetical protein